MPKSNFKDFISFERNLGKVIRFSAKTRLKDENVAEHSFHVAMYAMILADLEKKFGNKVDVERVLRASLIHDLEEALTGDILHDFKYSDPKVSRAIKNLASDFYSKIVSNLPKELAVEYSDIWKNQKDFSKIEGRIVFAADRLEALSYATEEFSLGNKMFKRVIGKLKKDITATKLKSAQIILKQMVG